MATFTNNSSYVDIQRNAAAGLAAAAGSASGTVAVTASVTTAIGFTGGINGATDNRGSRLSCNLGQGLNQAVGGQSRRVNRLGQGQRADGHDGLFNILSIIINITQLLLKRNKENFNHFVSIIGALSLCPLQHFEIVNQFAQNQPNSLVKSGETL
jgi:hypothetical protein